MTKARFEVDVERLVAIEIDEKKITKDVLEQFSAVMWKVHTVEEILIYIAHTVGTQDMTIREDSFIEGLGVAKDFGVKATVVDETTHVSRYPYDEEVDTPAQKENKNVL